MPNLACDDDGQPQRREAAISAEGSSYWWGANNKTSSSSSSSSSSSFLCLQNPGTVLLLASIPLCTGSFIGYKIPIDRVEDFVQGKKKRRKKRRTRVDNIASSAMNKNTTQKVKIVSADVKALAAQTASKALRIATLGTVGAFGFVIGLGFYVSGHNTVRDATTATKRWASVLSSSLEMFFGGDRGISKIHPEVIATKDMNEDEQLRYIYNKYIKDEYLDSLSLSSSRDDSNTVGDDEKENDPAPTLYMIYQKYFPKKES